jgi:hypothetical protein
MANPFPFVAGDVLTAADMNGIGETSTFTPSITNFTLGNGTAVGRFVRVNKLVYFRVGISFGSTTSIGAGAKDLTLPIAATNVATLDGLNILVHYYDLNLSIGVFNQPAICIGTTAVRLGANNVAGTYESFTDLSSTVPFTWATGDVLNIAGTYEVA